MKITQQQLNQIKKFATLNLKNNDSWHNVEHVEQVVKAAEYLAKKEKANVNQCIVSAWLHDISKHKEQKNKKINHGTDAATVAKPFLSKLGFDPKDVEEICYAIHMHNKTPAGKTKESKVLWDADKLRTLGPYGIVSGACNFCYSGLSQEAAVLKTLDEYSTYVYAYFRTKTAKKIEKKYNKLMRKFHKQYIDIRDVNFR